MKTKDGRNDTALTIALIAIALNLGTIAYFGVINPRTTNITEVAPQQSSYQFNNGSDATSWQNTCSYGGDCHNGLPNCQYYQFSAPTGVPCFPNAGYQPTTTTQNCMQTQLSGCFPYGSLKPDSKVVATPIIFEGTVAKLEIKSGVMTIIFADPQTISVSTSLVNISQIHVGSILRVYQTQTTTTDVLIAQTSFTLIGYEPSQQYCHWATPLGLVDQYFAQKGCQHDLNETIQPGSTFWTLNSSSSISIDKVEVVR